MPCLEKYGRKIKEKIKIVKKGKKKTQKEDTKSNLPVVIVSVIAFALFSLAMTSGFMEGTDLSPNSNVVAPVAKIIPLEREATGALFDIILLVPEKYREVKSGEELLLSVELFNFGGPGETTVYISYIITNSQGDVVLIEHEERTVETQDSFLKEIQLPEVKYGTYKVFIEMLYSNTSAVATSEFRVPLY